MITKARVYDQLKTVMDPELHIDIVSLGLIYDVKCLVIQGAPLVNVIMTLTTPGCPLAPEIDRLVWEAIKPLGKCEIKLDLVWEPAWTKEMMSEEAKLKLGMI